ncbi:MAG: endonuclease [Gammaproteobacteria bacterium]|jgi:endonuclease-3 related protein
MPTAVHTLKNRNAVRPAVQRRLSRRTLRAVHDVLFAHYGPQHWWPGDTPFEIMVGAVLTQNTAWSNVERAIANLVARNRLDPAAIVTARRDHLANWLRPSGYFNIKATRLKNFCRWYLEAGGYAALQRLDTDSLRAALLGVNGVGRETADDILLYAFRRPVFVIDAYTRRLFARLGLVGGDEDYDHLRRVIEQALGPDEPLFNEYHALIVRHAKEICRVRPDCRTCVLRRRCPAVQ